MTSYTQTHDANWRIPYVGGWCEGYVEGAWGQATLPTPSNQTTSGTWRSAMAKWNANPGGGNHPNELPPVGRTVPVYFSLGSTSNGHTAISLDDGSVASSTQAGFHTQGYIHPNLQNLKDVYGKYNNGCTYLGWSEVVGTIRVVTPVAAPVNNVTQGVDMIDQNTLNVLFDLFLGRAPDPDANSHYVGHYSTSFVVDDLNRSPEHASHVANVAADIANQVNAFTTQITNLQSQVNAVTAELTTAQNADTVDRATVKDLQGQLKTAQTALDVAKTELPTPTVAPIVTPITVVPTQTPIHTNIFSLLWSVVLTILRKVRLIK
jgi:hypothetical protein